MADPVLSDFVPGFRFKETLPKMFNATQVMQMAKGAQYAVSNLGVPPVAIDSLPQRILQEGRADAGTNSYNTNNKAAVDVYNKMKAAGFKDDVATYAAAVLDKSQVADRLKIPFDTAWNGTGRSADSGKTGVDYANQMLAQKSVIEDPRNAQLTSFIQRAAQDQLTPKEKLAQFNSHDLTVRQFGLTDSSSDLLGNGDADTFTRAIYQALDKAVPNTPHDVDSIIGVLGRGSNYASSIADNMTSLVRQKTGISLSARDKNNLSNSAKNPVLTDILEQLASPIAAQYNQ